MIHNIHDNNANYTITVDDIPLISGITMSNALDEIKNKVQLYLHSPGYRNCISRKVGKHAYIISGYDQYSIINVERPVHVLQIVNDKDVYSYDNNELLGY